MISEKEVVISVKKQKLKYKVETTKDIYSFSEETLIRYAIFKGKQIDSAELAVIIEEEDFNYNLNRAINYLSYQARSVNEIRKYLVEKDCNSKYIDQIIEKLTSYGYLNDEEFALNLLNYIIRSKKGPQFLEQKLIEKLISEDIINKTIMMYTNSEEVQVLNEIISDLLSKYKTYPKKKQKNLIYQKLLRDGFNYELINDILSTINFIDESDEQLEKVLRKAIDNLETLDNKSKAKIITKLLNQGYEYSKIIEIMNNFE